MNVTVWYPSNHVRVLALHTLTNDTWVREYAYGGKRRCRLCDRFLWCRFGLDFVFGQSCQSLRRKKLTLGCTLTLPSANMNPIFEWLDASPISVCVPIAGFGQNFGPALAVRAVYKRYAISRHSSTMVNFVNRLSFLAIRIEIYNFIRTGIFRASFASG